MTAFAASSDWRAAAIAMLAIRVIQGFIYWGGGSRRFFYAPWKLDPDQSNWMANKFQTAMPGALFGLDRLIAYLLQHFWLLYAGIILFSAIELFAGLALMVGLMTRLAAFASVGLSVALMLLFGWQGGTCIDEWTMASCSLAMGATLMLAGGAAYSFDNVLLRRSPALANGRGFAGLAAASSCPSRMKPFENLASPCFVSFSPSISASIATTGVRWSRHIMAAPSAPRRTISGFRKQPFCETAASASTSTSTAGRQPCRPTS